MDGGGGGSFDAAALAFQPPKRAPVKKHASSLVQAHAAPVYKKVDTSTVKTPAYSGTTLQPIDVATGGHNLGSVVVSTGSLKAKFDRYKTASIALLVALAGAVAVAADNTKKYNRSRK